MTQKSNHLQDLFLARAQRDKLGLTLFLMNGFQMRGTVAGFDAFTHYKSIVDKKTWLDLPMRYQPYRGTYEKLIHLFLR